MQKGFLDSGGLGSNHKKKGEGGSNVVSSLWTENVDDGGFPSLSNLAKTTSCDATKSDPKSDPQLDATTATSDVQQPAQGGGVYNVVNKRGSEPNSDHISPNAFTPSHTAASPMSSFEVAMQSQKFGSHGDASYSSDSGNVANFDKNTTSVS